MLHYFLAIMLKPTRIKHEKILLSEYTEKKIHELKTQHNPKYIRMLEEHRHYQFEFASGEIIDIIIGEE